MNLLHQRCIKILPNLDNLPRRFRENQEPCVAAITSVSDLTCDSPSIAACTLSPIIIRSSVPLRRHAVRLYDGLVADDLGVE